MLQFMHSGRQNTMVKTNEQNRKTKATAYDSWKNMCTCHVFAVTVDKSTLTLMKNENTEKDKSK